MAANQFCSQCGAALPPVARFCAVCGAQAGSTTSPDQVPVQSRPAYGSETAFPPSGGPITASDAVYLFGEAFVEKDNWHTEGITLESSGIKVQKKPLARVMVLAALAQLEGESWVEVPMVKMGVAIFKQDTPLLRPRRQEPCPLGGLEAALLGSIDPRGDQMNSIGQVLGRLVTGQHGTGMLSTVLSGAMRVEDPWWEVIKPCRAHLVETGHFSLVGNPSARGLGRLLNAKYRVEPDQPYIAGSAGQVGNVQSLLDRFRAMDRRRWEVASKHIDQSLNNLEARRDDNSRGTIRIG